jgi:flagella basal body P-ring formation protein FlgA
MPSASLRAWVRLALALGILAAGLPARPGIGAVVLDLAEQAEVAGEDILLREIAEMSITGANAGGDGAAAALADIVVGRAPRPGRTRGIDRDYVALRLRQHGFQPEAVILRGPPRIEVTRTAAVVPGSEVEAMVFEFLGRRIASSGADAEIEAVRGARDVVLPAGRVTRTLEIPAHEDLSGNVRVTVAFSVDGVPARRVHVYARIRRRISAVTAVRPMGRGKTITAADVSLQKMEASEVASNALVRIEDAVGKVARKRIALNTVLRPDMIARPYLVQRGDIVKIVARSARVNIVTLGEVRKKGRRDDRIRVLNLDSDEEIYARVIDAGTVAVNFYGAEAH